MSDNLSTGEADNRSRERQLVDAATLVRSQLEEARQCLDRACRRAMAVADLCWRGADPRNAALSIVHVASGLMIELEGIDLGALELNDEDDASQYTKGDDDV